MRERMETSYGTQFTTHTLASQRIFKRANRRLSGGVAGMAYSYGVDGVTETFGVFPKSGHLPRRFPKNPFFDIYLIGGIWWRLVKKALPEERSGQGGMSRQ
jgi:hypothetical protein